MKNLAFIFSILLMGFSANATSTNSEDHHRRGYDGSAYIFVEGDVEFSVFPDGQFDFVYVGPQRGSSVTINAPNVNISFNSGYDYDAYVQYDDYGAVIQVENVPIYYDYYGRIIQAGNVEIQYNDRRVVRVGGLHVIYNHYGYFSHCTGYINAFNPYYVYRPWHVYYAPPVYTHCIVYDMPYRRYYRPVRYSYHDHVVYYKNRHKVAYHNGRRDFYRPGTRVYDKRGRASINRNYDPNRKNTMIATGNMRSDRTVRNSSIVRNNNSRNNRALNSKNNRSETVTRSRASHSKGAAAVERNKQNDRKYINRTQNRNSVATRSGGSTKVNRNSVQNSRKSTRNENVKSATSKRSVSKPKTVQRQARATSNNRGSSVRHNKTQTPKRETASRSRSSVHKSSTPSRSNAMKKATRGSSPRNAKSSVGRG